MKTRRFLAFLLITTCAFAAKAEDFLHKVTADAPFLALRRSEMWNEGQDVHLTGQNWIQVNPGDTFLWSVSDKSNLRLVQIHRTWYYALTTEIDQLTHQERSVEKVKPIQVARR